MKQALIACRTGMGTSMMLKIKVDQVVREKKFDLEVHHSTLDDVKSFKGDVLITMSDVADELAEKGVPFHIIGIKNIMDKEEIEQALTTYFEQK